MPPDIDPRGPSWHRVGQSGLQRVLRQTRALPVVVPNREATLEILSRWETETARHWREWRGLTNRLGRAKTAWVNKICKDMCQHYGTIAVEALTLKRMAEQEDQEPRIQAGQKYRQLSSPSTLLLRLQHTAAREGVRVVRVDPAYSTLTCAVCGETVEQTGEIFLVCAHGHTQDTDVNAAKILWHRAFADETGAHIR